MRVMELHSPLKVIKRGDGRSATAAAAYRSASHIVCERTGQTHDYTRKQGVAATALLLPDDAPEWAHDRAQLWNQAELREKHPRAQPAREIEVSLPAEFTDRQRREAGLAIGNWIVSRYGVAADLAWHNPPKQADERNHHVHILFTTRRFENGEWAKTKDRALDDLKQGPLEVSAMRQAVADSINNIATRDHVAVYVEHLSFAKRDLDLEATRHMGPDATEMERRGKRTSIGDENRSIRRRNEERQRLAAAHTHNAQEAAREKLDNHRRMGDATHEIADAASQQSLRRAQAIQEQDPIDPYAAFYARTQARRRTVLEELSRQYGMQEKAAQQEITRRYQAFDDAGIFMRFWRRISGKEREDRDVIRKQTEILDQIHASKMQAMENFERQRQLELKSVIQERRQRREAECAVAEEKILYQKKKDQQNLLEAQKRIQQQAELRAAEQNREGHERKNVTDAWQQASEEKRQPEKQKRAMPSLPQQQTSRAPEKPEADTPASSLTEADELQQQKDREVEELLQKMNRKRERKRGLSM